MPDRRLLRRCITAHLLVLTLLLGCKERPPKVPGETDVHVASVEIEPAPGTKLELDHEKLFERLGMRKGSLVNPERTWSPFRESEDRRRIEAFWQTFGYFDVQVDPAEVVFSPQRDKVRITWHVRENQRYSIASVHLKQAPPEHETTLRVMIPFARGSTDIDLERYRKVRVEMADHLRKAGYGHANVYSRAWVDRTT